MKISEKMLGLVWMAVVSVLLGANSGCSAGEKLPPKPAEKSVSGTGAEEVLSTGAEEAVNDDQEKILNEKENPTGDIAKAGKFAGQRAVKIIDGLVYAFRWAPPGEFWMGSPDEAPYRQSDEIQHPVKLTKGFWVLETEVTVDMAKRISGTELFDAINSRVKSENSGAFFSDRIFEEPFSNTEKRIKFYSASIGRLQEKYYESQKEIAGFPMIGITYDEATAFCDKLGQKLGVKVSLPTEAQWEYACRAGSYGSIDLNGFGWHKDNRTRTASFWESGLAYRLADSSRKVCFEPVGSLSPNAWGLYDVLGGVSEWVRDFYDSDFYYKCYLDSKIAIDPCKETGSNRVTRGGSVLGDSWECRPAYRFCCKKDWLYCRGFRVIVVPE